MGEEKIYNGIILPESRTKRGARKRKARPGIEVKPKEQKSGSHGGYRPRKILMGFVVTRRHKFLSSTRPYSWAPLFSGLEINESIQVEEKRHVSMRGRVNKYNKPKSKGGLAPKQFIFEVDKNGQGWLGRIK